MRADEASVELQRERIGSLLVPQGGSVTGDFGLACGDRKERRRRGREISDGVLLHWRRSSGDRKRWQAARARLLPRDHQAVAACEILMGAMGRF